MLCLSFNPQRAVSVLKTTLSNASLEEKLKIEGEARSILVSILSHYADFENFLEDSMLGISRIGSGRKCFLGEQCNK